MFKLKTSAIIASIFSIVFSLSIANELSQFVDTLTFTLAVAFIIFILIMNEYFKVKSLSDKFNARNYTYIALIITFLMSFTLSGIGIYFWVNKTNVNRDQSTLTLSAKKFEINNYYLNQIDSVSNVSLRSTSYDLLIKNLDFWKNRNCHSDAERQQARENILKIEHSIGELEKSHETQKEQQNKRLKELQKAALANIQTKYQTTENKNDKNDFLFYIFFSLVTVTELMIVYIQYSIAHFYTPEQRKNLRILFNIVQKNINCISLDDIRYDSNMNPQKSRDEEIRKEALNFRFLLGDLGIIEKESDKKGLIINKEMAYKSLRSYYDKINTL